MKIKLVFRFGGESLLTSDKMSSELQRNGIFFPPSSLIKEPQALCSGLSGACVPPAERGEFPDRSDILASLPALTGLLFRFFPRILLRLLLLLHIRHLLPLLLPTGNKRVYLIEGFQRAGDHKCIDVIAPAIKCGAGISRQEYCLPHGVAAW